MISYGLNDIVVRTYRTDPIEVRSSNMLRRWQLHQRWQSSYSEYFLAHQTFQTHSSFYRTLIIEPGKDDMDGEYDPFLIWLQNLRVKRQLTCYCPMHNGVNWPCSTSIDFNFSNLKDIDMTSRIAIRIILDMQASMWGWNLKRFVAMKKIDES